MRDPIRNWPENAAPGSHSMHLHYRELLDMWNFHEKADGRKGDAFIDTEAEKLGVSVVTFNERGQGVAFIAMHKLDDFVVVRADGNAVDGGFVQLRNSFDLEILEEFFAVLDEKRIDLMQANVDWDRMTPSLNSVFSQSARVFHTMKRAHDSITHARTILGKAAASITEEKA